MTTLPSAVLSGSAQWALVHGDCLGPEGMATLPDGSISHVITDPPYSEHVHSKSRRGLTVTHRGGAQDEISERRELGFEALSEDTMIAVADQVARLTERWCLVFCDVESSQNWAGELRVSGLEYLRTCAWIKIGGAPQFTGDRPAVGFEAIVCSHRPGRKHWNGGGKSGVYSFPVAIDREHTGDARVHTAQKPLALMQALVRDFTDPGDLICDPFAGSGTTGVACLSMGRRFIGWEKDAAYYEIARKRLERTREQLTLCA